jgi:succinate dehydrogenase flavin-adding protein (antitoxin of CptAB toxin-antitoxin module)
MITPTCLPWRKWRGAGDVDLRLNDYVERKTKELIT